MRGISLLVVAAMAVAACRVSEAPASAPDNASSSAPKPAQLTLTRLDCGSGEFKDLGGFFSDRPGIYPLGPGKVTNSCYLIRHGDQLMIWDTGFPATLKGSAKDMGGFIATLDTTLAEQLAKLGLKPADIDVVGISHMHGDHVGQAAEFPQARLIIGAEDFEEIMKPAGPGKPSPIEPWLKDGAKVTAATSDIDIFGDGRVVALRLPGHTNGNLGLLVKLANGPVLLTGDLYHSTIAREKRAVPPFNTSRTETLASMERFEKLAKGTGAKVIIQHEPADIAKIPAFPAAAE
jgi:glyoxylase-like metal-dependent hydrolase (beta-lactamase superfamily II)